MGFCYSREHAEKMAEDFMLSGIPAAAVYSGEQGEYALALREELEPVIHDPAFVGHVKDVIDYRTMDYYQRRYAEQEK